jgi:CheY-like chemotaxis protein
MILIVDDFRDGAEALCRLITRHGYPCKWIGSGPEALAYIRSHPPEQPLLVVLDHMMPEMRGIEVLRQIRQDPRISATAVMFFSAGFDVGVRDEALTLGALAWVLKGGAGTSVEGTLEAIEGWYLKGGGVPIRLPPGAS